jgi:mRNA-degrading endonuclease RelE of RelBE toxin-antitoxin system
MTCEVLTTEKFERQAKRLLKKYPSLKKEIIHLEENLSENPKLGTSLGNNFYKIRLAIKSKGKGKSGGARVITFLIFSKKQVREI